MTGRESINTRGSHTVGKDGTPERVTLYQSIYLPTMVLLFYFSLVFFKVLFKYFNPDSAVFWRFQGSTEIIVGLEQ